MAGVAVTQSRHEGEGEELASRAVLSAEAVERYTVQHSRQCPMRQRRSAVTSRALLPLSPCILAAAAPRLQLSAPFSVQCSAVCTVHKLYVTTNNQTKQSTRQSDSVNRVMLRLFVHRDTKKGLGTSKPHQAPIMTPVGRPESENYGEFYKTI